MRESQNHGTWYLVRKAGKRKRLTFSLKIFVEISNLRHAHQLALQNQNRPTATEMFSGECFWEIYLEFLFNLVLMWWVKRTFHTVLQRRFATAESVKAHCASAVILSGNEWTYGERWYANRALEDPSSTFLTLHNPSASLKASCSSIMPLAEVDVIPWEYVLLFKFSIQTYLPSMWCDASERSIRWTYIRCIVFCIPGARSTTEKRVWTRSSFVVSDYLFQTLCASICRPVLASATRWNCCASSSSRIRCRRSNQRHPASNVSFHRHWCRQLAWPFCSGGKFVR